jgi:NADPH-dependent 2,4-dienoyl-CoA reductase/sulfur reductase-like enzyme
VQRHFVIALEVALLLIRRIVSTHLSGDIFRREVGNRGVRVTRKDDRMRALIVGAGMGGLMTALALRQSGVFASIDIYEQTKVPSTAGAGLNIPPNGARICRWLGVRPDRRSGIC